MVFMVALLWVRVGFRIAKRRQMRRLFKQAKAETRTSTADCGEALSAYRAQQASDPDLKTMGLASVPSTFETLKAARKSAMLKAHPDRGGSDEMVHRVTEAYERLLAKFGFDGVAA